MAFPIEVHDDRYQLYDVYFHSDQILTTVTSDPDVVTNWINGIEYIHRRRLNRLIVGLDVEWRPNFNRYQKFPVATLQLCVGRRCLIFQLIYCRYIPDALTDFLLNPCYVFVGVGVANDAEKLEEDYELYVQNTVDLRPLAANVYNSSNLRNAGLKTLCQVVLGREMEKQRHITMGRWDNEWLDTDQVQYACVDAFVSFEIGKCLNASGY
ncbi:3'-5' exonuclease-like [Solanum dulcamara]|uniref:3'-5' exonuclease-like n=1 Tax=Solanum dulcamara TaxID=45834 RepID=UPI002485110C|nr:3'-5' exonuclease-like [Solanum dulcamara]